MSAGHKLNRRFFLQAGLVSTGITAVAGVAAWRSYNRKKSKASPANPFAYDASSLEKIDPKWQQFRMVSRFQTPRHDARCLAMGPDNRLRVGAGNRISMVTEHGVEAGVFSASGTVRCLAMDTEGRLYCGLRDHIEVFTAKGQRERVWEPTGPRGFISGITCSTQAVYVADSGQLAVWKCNKEGKVIGKLAVKDAAKGVPGLIAPSPYCDVQWHQDGLLRVANTGRHQVEMYNEDGGLEMVWGKAGMGLDGFCGCCNPINLGVMPEGRTITCEKGIPRVKIYSTKGILESVVVGPVDFPTNTREGTNHDPSKVLHAGVDAVADSKGRVYVADFCNGTVLVMEGKG